ncbi:hypothetical protein [Siccirubricoccus phaeus]|uniref:hypothetical protein n=1 Tax=Siccirubricoccus phaeus TaxID=2595053 RepID=UPI0011F0FE00|nr:hypothetical protein [Siccirubricoccus phaeus]
MDSLATLLGGFGAAVMLVVTLAAVLLFGWRRVFFSRLGVAVDLAGYLLCALLLAGVALWLLG